MDTNTTALGHSAPLDTATDHRSELNVVSWFLISVSFFFVIVRCYAKWSNSRKFGLDDALIVLSMVLAILTTVTMTLAVSYGLGLTDWEQGSENQIEKLQKACYAFSILFFVSQSPSKLSVVVFIRTLTPNPRHRFLASILGVGIALWTIIGIFIEIFRCHTPVWKFQNTCINRLAALTFLQVANIIFELCIILLPVLIVSHLQLRLRSKLILIGAFTFRVLVIAAIIFQLVIVFNNEHGSPFLLWSFVITAEVILNLEIFSACVPYLKPFLQNINSGMIRSDDIRRRGTNTTVRKKASKAKSNHSKKISSHVSSKKMPSHTSSKKMSSHASNRTEASMVNSFIGDEAFNSRRILPETGQIQGNRHQVTITSAEDRRPFEWEAGRVNFIRQTDTFSIRSEHLTD